MPLSSEKSYGIHPMTEAINNLPPTATLIRSLGFFKPTPLTTKYVDVESKNGELSLVTAVPRGTPGEPVKTTARGKVETFHVLHLPKHDVVMADDVQDVRSFGSDNKAVTVAEIVNDKLADMKADIEYTREHLMLGALQGKILNADGKTVIVDIYERFGLTRPVYNSKLSSDATNIGKDIDAMKNAQSKRRRGEAVKGWVALCSEEYLQALVYHKSVYDVYMRYQEAKAYREDDTNIAFRHKGIDYMLYDHEFESGLKIPAGEGILLPAGTRNTFKEYFAPANTDAAVNTKAKPYYASREPLGHRKGWDLEAQSNPLPLILRPELVATLKMT